MSRIKNRIETLEEVNRLLFKTLETQSHINTQLYRRVYALEEINRKK